MEREESTDVSSQELQCQMQDYVRCIVGKVEHVHFHGGPWTLGGLATILERGVAVALMRIAFAQALEEKEEGQLIERVAHHLHTHARNIKDRLRQRGLTVHDLSSGSIHDVLLRTRSRDDYREFFPEWEE